MSENKKITLTDGTTVNQRTRKSIFKVDPREIIFNSENNPRKFYGTKEEWKAHKESIRQHGVKDAIKIQNTREGTILVHGYRRLIAVMELIAEGVDIEFIKCEVMPVNYTEEQILMDHITLNSGLSLTPLEESGIYQQLMNYGWTQKQIATSVGKTQGAISNTLKLASLPMRVQTYINEGLVSSSLVMHLIKHHKNDYKLVEKALTKVIEMDDGVKTKVTAQTVMVKRVSKYHKLFSGVIDEMVKRNSPKIRIQKAEAILVALDSKTPDEFVDAILEVL